MKKKVHMSCVLKSGTVVKDAFRVKKDEIRWINLLKEQIEDACNMPAGTPGRMTAFTFGHTTVIFDEVAAVTIW